jgi:hypothetical protein
MSKAARRLDAAYAEARETNATPNDAALALSAEIDAVKADAEQWG